MEFVLLADCPNAVDKVANWYFQEWVSGMPGASIEDVIAQVSASVNRESAPMMVLARDAGEVIGAAELKVREMDIFPEYKFWLGGVYVDKACRGAGLAARLVEEVVARAQAVGIRRLYLQTENLRGGLYRQHGFEPLEELTYRGRRVLVMVARISAGKVKRNA